MKPTLISTSILAIALLMFGCGDQKPAASTSQPVKVATPAQENFENITTKLLEPAFGNIDGINNVTSPKLGSTVAIKEDKIAIGGFAVDAVKGDAAAGVIVMIDGKPFVTTYGGERPDIAKALNNPKYLKSQFYVEIPSAAIGAGLRELKLRVVASDKSGYYQSDVAIKLDVK
jgi:hypothetical protein